ncbi:HAD family hydrolase [Streptomyces sp. NPDC126497]|uniref:HAD family hydrolase n=1 Tax=Streptomyces sp. NPDC126497 TaxID=3155313 RepID=UPI0033259024
MTSETTTRTGPVTTGTGSEGDGLRKLVGGARTVLWGFDGPVCRLFAGRSAERVANGLVSWLEERGLRDPLTEAERASPDPHVVLRAAGRRKPGGGLVAELEERLTREEVRAAATAMPTPYADPLIRTWSAVGVRLAVATDTSPRAVRAYLTGRGLAPCFGPHLYGRTRGPGRLKPDPHCVDRALNAMAAAAETSLMLGDSPSDLIAARSAGVPFLGYARTDRKAGLLREAGATTVVDSLEVVLRLVRR